MYEVLFLSANSKILLKCLHNVQSWNDAIASLIHWALLKQAGVQVQPLGGNMFLQLLDTNNFKWLWSFTVITDYAIYNELDAFAIEFCTFALEFIVFALKFVMNITTAKN